MKKKKDELHGMWYTSEYRSWDKMVQRTTNPKNNAFKDYGGRGIKICDEWRNSFKAFYDYVGSKPSPEHSIDRINNDGNYEPGNVRWATKKEQANNRRPRQFKPTSSGFIGVYHVFKRGHYIDSWRATIRRNGKNINVGSFSTPNEAHTARQKLLMTADTR